MQLTPRLARVASTCPVLCGPYHARSLFLLCGSASQRTSEGVGCGASTWSEVEGDGKCGEI
jgi:hypothetical protein